MDDGHLSRAFERVSGGVVLPEGMTHDPMVEAQRQHAVARVRAYLEARDGFYGREALDENVIEDGYVYDAEDTALLYSDLRLLVGLPEPDPEEF